MEPKKYFKIRKRYIPTVWPAYTYWMKMDKVTGVKSSILHLWEKERLYTGFVDIEGIKKRGQWVYEYILNNYKYDLKGLRNKGNISAKNLIKECKIFSESLEDKTFKDYADFYEKIDNLYIKYYEDNMLLWVAAEGVVTNRIKELLLDYSEMESEEIWSVMSTPTEPSYSNFEEKEFNDLVNMAKNNGISSEDFIKEVKLFSEKYVWFPFEYGGPEIFDEESVISRIKDVLNESKEESTSGDKIETASHQQDIINKYSLSEEIVLQFNILQTLALMHDDRKATNSHVCYLVNGLVLKKLAEITNMDQYLLYMVDSSLIRELAETEDINNFKKSLEKRDEMLVIYLSEEDKITFAEGEAESISLLQEHGINLESNIDNSEIKGKTAFKGKVTGIARLVNKSGECSKLNKGDILVTYMTTPDFVPYLDKVSAIVTEEGGITCHAAIVARELKKPCVIGTGNVMSVLNDGDQIEVDADNGIINIIK
jgi:phosphohistidine swiveling domain-containing protein